MKVNGHFWRNYCIRSYLHFEFSIYFFIFYFFCEGVITQITCIIFYFALDLKTSAAYWRKQLSEYFQCMHVFVLGMIICIWTPNLGQIFRVRKQADPDRRLPNAETRLKILKGLGDKDMYSQRSRIIQTLTCWMWFMNDWIFPTEKIVYWIDVIGRLPYEWIRKSSVVSCRKSRENCIRIPIQPNASRCCWESVYCEKYIVFIWISSKTFSFQVEARD